MTVVQKYLPNWARDELKQVVRSNFNEEDQSKIFDLLCYAAFFTKENEKKLGVPVSEAAKYLGVSQALVRKYLKDGQLFPTDEEYSKGKHQQVSLHSIFFYIWGIEEKVDQITKRKHKPLPRNLTRHTKKSSEILQMITKPH